MKIKNISDTETNLLVGKEIRIKRDKLQLTQTKVGDAINVTFQQVQKYEKATNGLSLVRFISLCKLFKTDPTKFLIEAGAWNPNQSEIKITEVKISDLTKDHKLNLNSSPSYFIIKNEKKD